MTAVDVSSAARPLRSLYLTRSVFALVWAGLLLVSARTIDAAGGIGALPAVLLVLYPLVDVAAAVIDRRSSRAGGPRALLVVNGVLSLATGVALAVAVTSGVGPVLVTWGLWAITAGLVQLAVGVRRRALGGQWPMILSGGISVLAGASFIAGASSSSSVDGLAGYAVLGGVFFLVSALRLRGGAGAGAR